MLREAATSTKQPVLGTTAGVVISTDRNQRKLPNSARQMWDRFLGTS